MAKNTEVRLSQSTVLAIIAIVAVGLIGWNAGWFEGDSMPTPTGNVVGDTPTMSDGNGGTVGQGTPLQLVPAIEKTKVYASTFDQADKLDDAQDNRVTGTMQLIKSGNAIETVSTTTSAGAASSSEFNGGDKLVALADATNYYAKGVEEFTITETLQPVEQYIWAAAAPTLTVLDEDRDELSAPYSLNLTTDEESQDRYIELERPGEDSRYQFCGVAVDYDDEQVQPFFENAAGNMVEGIKDLNDDYDYFDDRGYDEVWRYDAPIERYDDELIKFFIAAEEGVDPASTGAFNITFSVFDCEDNLQNGKVVYTPETFADGDVGLANLNFTIQIE